MTNLIFLFLLGKKGIYWQSDNFKLPKIKYRFKVVVKQLIGNFFLSIIDLPDFVFLLQNSNLNKLDVNTIHCNLGHMHIDNIIK